MNPAARLLNLVIALVNASASMTKQQIRVGVAGYGEASSPEAFERMFERDKDLLRALGVPVVTVDGGGHSGDVGYRVDTEAYGLALVELTPAEFGVLALAAQLWQDRTVRTDASRGLAKLRVVTVGEEAHDMAAGWAPRVRPVGESYGPLVAAIEDRRVVRFMYRAASTGQLHERDVEPWRVVARGGGWYVVGFDRDRGAPRAFRLSRVQGRVRVVGPVGAFELPHDVDVDGLLGGSGESGVATVAVVPERAGTLRARGSVIGAVGGGDGGRDVLEVAYSAAMTFIDEVVGYGDAVVVMEPVWLREIVVARLRRAAAWEAECCG